MVELVYNLYLDDFSAEEKLVRAGLDEHRAKETSLEHEPIAFICRGKDDKIIGGVVAKIIGKSLNIKLLWVDKAARGQSIGASLMNKLEDHARSKGCKKSFVDTMSYQAGSFYKSLFYTEVARIVGFEDDEHDKIFFHKDL